MVSGDCCGFPAERQWELPPAAIALREPDRIPIDVFWRIAPAPVRAVLRDLIFEPRPEHFGSDAHALFVRLPVFGYVRARLSLSSFFLLPLFEGVRDMSRDRSGTVPGHIGTLSRGLFCSPHALAIALICWGGALQGRLGIWRWSRREEDDSKPPPEAGDHAGDPHPGLRDRRIDDGWRRGDRSRSSMASRKE